MSAQSCNISFEKMPTWMPSPLLTSPKLFPWKSWVLGPKPSFGQAAKGWAGKQQGSAGNLLGRCQRGLCLSEDLLACMCFQKTLSLWKIYLSIFKIRFGFLGVFLQALVRKYYQCSQCWSVEYTSCSFDSVGMTVG